MKPPPIRYPLPTLLVLLAVFALARSSGDWLRSAVARLAPAAVRAQTAEPFPSSTTPIMLLDNVPMRVLLLGPDVPLTETPGGAALEPIRHTRFARVFNSWPTNGISTHLRIGNKTPIGWVESGRTLGWTTRLIVRSPGLPELPAGLYPVLSHRDGQVVVGTWKPGKPWSEAGQPISLPSATLPATAWQVWCSEDELRSALARSAAPKEGQPAGAIRYSALFGETATPRTTDLVQASRPYFPAEVNALPFPSHAESAQRLAKINQNWAPDATWGGVPYRAIEVTDLP